MKISVPDMSCMHCKMALEASLGQVAGIVEISVDFPSKTVSVEGDVSWETVASAIRKAGYTAEKAVGEK